MNKTVVSKRDLGKDIQTTIQLSNKDKSFITSGQVKQIINRLEVNGTKVVVRGLNIERWMTLKSMNGEFDDEAFDDYYKNKVKESDVDKFTTFAQVQITAFKPK
jgi:capsule polysaccharide export protein KpsE/RkpR